MAVFGNLAAAVSSKFGRNDYVDDYEEDEYLDDDYEEEKPRRKAAPEKGKGFGNISPFKGMKKAEAPMQPEHEVYAIQPTSMDDVKEITEKLLDGWTVVLNTERCDDALARRIFDYTCGTVYALNCAFGRVSYSPQNSPSGVYIITPENTNISGAFQENFVS